ncbi:MAG TPA: winged helix-turn-helix domain-containing protein [Candidatus Limnocylindrales bacterium]|nr:winged helix-turn-helix domain-containing protein [Candidatus Limnocylindrales bacterium]
MSTTSRNIVAFAGFGPALHVAVETGTAYELVLTGLAVVDRDGHRRWDAGVAWRDRARAVDDGTLVRSLDRIARESWVSLLGLAHELDGERSASALVDAIDTLDPVEVVLHLVGAYRRVIRRATPPETIRAAVAGDARAQREFRRTSFPALRDWQATLRWALGQEPAETREQLVASLRALARDVLGPVEGSLADLQLRDARIVAELAATTGPETLISSVAPGITYVPEVGQTEVVLVPDAIVRPSVVVLDHRASLIVCYPASADRASAGAPPERLVALGKAIGDETRLRVLRLLADGPLTGTELAERLGVPRTSLHYHLGLLRAAGLVEVAVDDARYGRLRLRDESLDDVGRLLAAFVLDEPASASEPARVRRGRAG